MLLTVIPKDNEVAAMSDVGERVKKIVVKHLGVEAEKVIENASFIEGLGADRRRARTFHVELKSISIRRTQLKMVADWSRNTG
jgi:hypothetical protein